jgi:hypothetical protein
MMTPPDVNPVTVMLAEIIRLQEAAPFRPFVIITSSGKTYEIPTPDHLTITRRLRRISIEYDDCSGVDLSPLHVTAVEVRPPVGP